jgi:hypothetical protein
VKNRVTEFTVKQIRQILDMVERPNDTVYYVANNFKVCQSSVQLNGWQIGIKHLRSVRFNFHPVKLGPKYGSVYGRITVLIETNSPHFVFEEPISNKVYPLYYAIHGKHITYTYSSFFNKLFSEINQALKDGEENFDAAVRATMKYEETQKSKKNQQKANQNAQQNTQSNQSYANQSGARQNTQYTQGSANQNRANQQNQQRQQRTNNTNNSSSGTSGNRQTPPKQKSPLDDAMSLYGLKIPFTQVELNKARGKLMKIHHPDVGGSEEMAKKINAAYEILSHYAVK